jgi:two-component system, sensor histidine kinase and response regulator
LMGIQWIAGVVFALWVSPLTWSGPVSRTHLHVWAAIIVCGTISLFPAVLALVRAGRPSTRYTIAAAQMLMGALLIHLTRGRLETHFHVFGSLAFLAFYRDWRVLVPATIVVALDHMLRGVFWPQSVYGVLVVSQWRWVEHSSSCLNSRRWAASTSRGSTSRDRSMSRPRTV